MFPCVFFKNGKSKVHLYKKKLQINVKEKDNEKPMTQWFVGKPSKILSTIRFEKTIVLRKGTSADKSLK